MQCDFYRCADLLDELKTIMKKESEERLRRSRQQGTLCLLGMLYTFMCVDIIL